MYYYRVYDGGQFIGYCESEDMIIKDNYDPMFESDYFAAIEELARQQEEETRLEQIAALKTQLATLEAAEAMNIGEV